MDILQAIILGIVQGATEFLPISSSGHLALVPWWLGWAEPSSLTFTVAVHLGTLLAVLIYFWQDWLHLLQGFIDLLRTRTLDNPYSRLFVFLVLGSIPVAIVGLLFESTVAEIFQSPVAAAGFLLVTAALLVFSERATAAGSANRELKDMKLSDALFIGTAQVLAILPGVSRSGSTIAAGLFRGISRTEAARFSFLLATPAIVGAGLLTALDLLEAGTLGAELPMMVAGFISAALVGYLAITFLLRYLQQHRLYIFAAYCTAAGLLSLLAALLGR